MNQDASTADNFVEQRRAYQVGPGPTLRHAREEAGLSIEDVAAQLRLSPQLILDIEDDNYSNMLFTFTRGYLRAYARLMELPPEEIVSAFNALELSETPRPQSPLVQGAGKGAKLKDRQSAVSHEKVVRWISFLVVFALLVSVGLWWHGQNNSVSIPLSHLLGGHSATSTLPTTTSTTPMNSDPSAENAAGANAANNTTTTPAVGPSANAATTPGTSSSTTAAVPVPAAPTVMNEGNSSIETAAAPTATVVTPPAAAANADDSTAADATATSATDTPPATPKHRRFHPAQSASSANSYGEIVPQPYSNNSNND